MEEEMIKTKKKFEKMMGEGTNGFWRERRAMKKDETSEWMVMKDENGKRMFDPQKSKEIVASYYEKLYANGNPPYHPYHDEVTEKIAQWSVETTEEQEIDQIPSRKEIEEVIKNKKNKKATSDWKNEILKKGGKPMVEMIVPVIEMFWREEKPPKQWNEGVITNVYKGKGDREKMENQRGITVSSGVGTIGEEVLTNRLMKTIKFTQAQAGGRKGGCTTDHIFILKGLISLAMKKGQELIITFFDIKKAYDRADMDDMLYIVHQQGFEGKIWRLTKSMNEELTAKVKTKARLTREIRREKGGKQGGKLMVPLFAKMMDKLPEEMNEVETLGIKVDDMKIPALVYVDDATSLAIGYTQQQITLDAINEFAIKHKLEWGAEKCKVMEIGSHKEKKTEWKLGEKIITNCQDYKYLGQTISRDGKSKENLSAIFSKVKATVRAIITCAKSEVMKNIETDVVLKLHEACTIPTFLTNSETWSLNAEERKEADKIEMWALNDMFGLPITTPNAGIVFAL